MVSGGERGDGRGDEGAGFYVEISDVVKHGEDLRKQSDEKCGGCEKIRE